MWLNQRSTSDDFVSTSVGGIQSELSKLPSLLFVKHIGATLALFITVRTTYTAEQTENSSAPHSSPFPRHALLHKRANLVLRVNSIKLNA
ncbi:hypothetical protein T4D_12094 [Trichinella pseudospiralis]|uniref:Uncharacterized protein n=1 Tax=Trichinella pseudospiralis TaxID=6337 RepID=A0A0V1G0I7_TRIPS|nr:hypothetical protein T4D_12094 [Trichinella pseudospiralis]